MSSLSSDGGALIDPLLSSDEGANWALLISFANPSIQGVAPRSTARVAATCNGMHRPTHAGGCFSLLSGAATGGFPAGGSLDRAGHRAAWRRWQPDE